MPDRCDRRRRRRPRLARPRSLHPLRALRLDRAGPVRVRGRLRDRRPPSRPLGNGDAPAVGVAELRATLGERTRTLERSIHIRHVDAGSDGGEEWEIQALVNPYYDIQRLGFFFTLSPRHADILLVSGVVTDAMREPLRRAWETMPEPKALIAAGTDACSGGFAATAESAGGVDQVLPVDVYVPGSPPSPIALLHGLLLATGLLAREDAA